MSRRRESDEVTWNKMSTVRSARHSKDQKAEKIHKHDLHCP